METSLLLPPDVIVTILKYGRHNFLDLILEADDADAHSFCKLLILYADYNIEAALLKAVASGRAGVAQHILTLRRPPLDTLASTLSHAILLGCLHGHLGVLKVLLKMSEQIESQLTIGGLYFNPLIWQSCLRHAAVDNSFAMSRTLLRSHMCDITKAELNIITSLCKPKLARLMRKEGKRVLNRRTELLAPGILPKQTAKECLGNSFKNNQEVQ